MSAIESSNKNSVSLNNIVDDMEAITSLILMQDLRLIVEESQEMVAAKQMMSSLIDEIKKAIAENTRKYTTINQPSEVFKKADDFEAKVNVIMEISEITSLRLQMMMDRRSKFISTLSNIMKKISATQDTLVQNLK
jgi:hypothetical protein